MVWIDLAKAKRRWEGKKNLEACPEVFGSNFHGLAKLEFETCIEACL